MNIYINASFLLPNLRYLRLLPTRQKERGRGFFPSVLRKWLNSSSKRLFEVLSWQNELTWIESLRE